ncbi:MAG: rhodanese-like domain-containing protein [Cyclobacteriaceae bacterium]|nr:rhodanese-like domain-containing protein [Cyclobacteriaceae bacterium]
MTPDIQIQELKERLEKGEQLHIIDVREHNEFEQQNIGGVLIPLNSLPENIEKLIPLKDQELLILCRSGNRSGKAKRYLESKGFTHVRNIIGGIDAYFQS